ncbi:hypothetical protein GCM10027447_04250 [Glycomyces halotolerans]
MFSNVSPAWRRRLRIIVAAWAVLLVTAAFFGTRATVREQADAAEGREAADAAVGVAASALAGDAFEFHVGPPAALTCSLTPVRDGVEYTRTFLIVTDEPEVAFAQAGAALADHFGTERPESDGHWRHTSAAFVNVRLDVDTEAPAVRGAFTTGCRPSGAAFGAVVPSERPGWITLAEAHPGLEAAGARIEAYGRIECARGGTVETWWWDAGADEPIPSTRDECR